MAKAPRQTANLAQLARMPVTPASARVLPREQADARQQAVGNQALQRLLRVSASGGSDARPVRPELERTLESEAGGGQALSREERSFFEPRFGRDLGNVRLHTDQQAAAAAREVNARAFTRGHDVYFAEGQYQPHSDAGRRLMAHELTHTLQQASPEVATPAAPVSDAAAAPAPATVPVPSASAGIQRSADPSVIRRANGDAASPPGEAAAPMSPKTGVLDEATNTITFDEIKVPGFKVSGHRKALYESRKLMRKRSFTRPDVAQRDDWKKGVGTEGIKTKLTEKYNKATANAPVPAEFIFKSPPGGQPRYFIGDLATAATEMTTPYWTSAGANRRYDVDHIVEMQLDGQNTLDNMELLESKKNSSSGSTIEKNIKAKAKEFVTATNGKYGASDSEIAAKYDLVFSKAVGDGGGDLTPRVDYWEQKDITAGEQIIDGVSVMTAADLDKEKQVARVFPAPSGTPKEFRKGDISGSDRDWLEPYILTAKDLKTDPEDKDSSDFGTLTFTAPESKDWEITEKEMVITIARIPGAQYAGRWDKSQVRQKLSKWRKAGLSPIRIDDVDVTPAGMVVTGQISLEEISFLQGVFIDFEMSRGSLTFSKEFSVGDFKAPAPLTVTESTLKVSAGTESGVRIDGRVDFKIEKVGDGYLGAGASTTGGFALEGGFNFDKELFTPPARIDMSYIDDKFKASGVLTIGEGKVKGIKKGTITATYDAGVLSATGNAELDMPAVQQASMEVKYSEATGLAIKGKASLKDGIPGIKSGSVEAEVKQGEGGWMVNATGSATSSIAGFDTALTISYTDGIFTAEATAGYKTSKLSGTITVGATNRAVDESGTPAGGASEALSAFGGGSITAQLTPWLKGTIGVRIKPEGGVIVSGEIGLPAPVELFPEKKVETTIFSVSTTVPTPIPGVVVKIGGSLGAYASFGPGQLKDAKIGVVYDPDHEENTTILGSATFYVPAKAGLELGVSAGIGLGITGASVSGNLEIQGGLGIKGFGSATAVVNWTPAQGLDLKATAEFEAQPAFTFKINGFFLVEVLGYDLWKPKWNLASFEYGSNLTVGVSIPIHYREGQPFNISWDDVTFKKPDINIDELLSGLLEKTGL
jgi:hypothetical protein